MEDQIQQLAAALAGSDEVFTAEQELEDVEAEIVAAEQFERLVAKVERHIDWCKATNDRRNAENRWADCQNFWLGKQWDGIKSYNIPARSAESKRLHPNPVDNYFKAHIEGILGDITDRPVDIQIKPREPGDDGISSKLNGVIDYLWYANRGDRKLEFIGRRGLLYNTLIAKVHWDNSVQGSPSNPYVGDVRFFGVLPTNIFIDPRVKATEEGAIEQAGFVIYPVRRSLHYIRNTYPEKGHLVTADTYASYVSTLTQDEDSDLYIDDTEVLLMEYWYKGDPIAPEFPPNPDGPAEPQPGWVHKAVIAGGVLVEHRTYVYPWYPFVMEWIYPSDESIYGYSDGYDILLPQLVINKLNELGVEGAKIASQGNWLVEEGNIRNKGQFQKYAGIGGSLLPVVDINRVRREDGGNVPSSLFAHYRQQMSALETVCGRPDTQQGRTPRNIQAASAIALLLQQSGGRIRQRSRALSSFVEQICRKAVDLVGMNYTEERLIRIVGDNNEIRWEPVSNADFIKTKTWIDPLTGQQHMEEYIPEFDVVVSAGTETPTSRAYYGEMAIQLFQQGVIDDEALLDTIQFPQWREILARKRMVEQQMMMAQQGMMPPQEAPMEQGNEMPPDAEMAQLAQMIAQMQGQGGGM